MFSCDFFIALMFFSLIFVPNLIFSQETKSTIGRADGPWKKFEIKLASLINVNCHGGNNGSIEINLVGGKKPYTSEWFKDSVSISKGLVLDSLKAGKYTFIATDSKKRTLETTFEIKEPKPIKLSLISYFNPTCKSPDKNNGNIRLKVSGGTPPYRSKWYLNGRQLVDIKDSFNQQKLKAGTYKITVTDSDGCMGHYNHMLAHPQCN